MVHDPDRVRKISRPRRVVVQKPPPPYDQVLIYDLTLDDCHWPHGDHPPFLFCGRPVVPGRHPYCAHHMAKARPAK